MSTRLATATATSRLSGQSDRVIVAARGYPFVVDSPSRAAIKAVEKGEALRNVTVFSARVSVLKSVYIRPERDNIPVRLPCLLTGSGLSL
jgi:hypothetical protein